MSKGEQSMKVGDVVEVFEYPFTKMVSEGMAEIKYIWYEDENSISASIEFLSEDAEGIFHRVITKGE